jgi:hypothetical protein
MKFPPFAKAIVAAILTGAAPSVAAATSTGGVTSTSTVESVVAAVLGYVATYWVPNGKSAKDVATGLVVNVKTDVGAFAAAFVAGLPALVQSSAEAAIQPAKSAADVPAPTDPAAPAADTTPVA